MYLDECTHTSQLAPSSLQADSEFWSRLHGEVISAIKMAHLHFLLWMLAIQRAVLSQSYFHPGIYIQCSAIIMCANLYSLHRNLVLPNA